MDWLKARGTKQVLTSVIQKIEVHVEEMRYERIVTDCS
jgi:hypothetical protein